MAAGLGQWLILHNYPWWHPRCVGEPQNARVFSKTATNTANSDAAGAALHIFEESAVILEGTRPFRASPTHRGCRQG